MKIHILLAISTMVSFLVTGQDCNLQLSGYLKDKSTNSPLEFANVFVLENQLGTVTDSDGFFKIEGLCEGTYHLRFSHIGCQPENRFVRLFQDTLISVFLEHHTELLHEVVVHGSQEDNSTQSSATISRLELSGKSNKGLAEILESIAGVSSLKNGSGISKPVIHGLFGNRVAIVHNGMLQAGQQWGNDHAPEIDPYSADHLSVIKGAAALAYGGTGAVVLVEAGEMKQDPHFHGEVNYLLESNGVGNTLNTRVEKSGKWLDWRATGTLKVRGDQRSPTYFLNNTGLRESNFSFQGERAISKKWTGKVYYSLFSARIGILRGSHIGNLTDLESALKRDEPFFTESSFSYQIDAPRQLVQHHLWKMENRFFISEKQVLKIDWGGQLNHREEYDVRRSGRSDTPALGLNQFTQYLHAEYNRNLDQELFLKSGIQFNFVDNANNPETGILPLIPDYRTYAPAFFGVIQKENARLFWETGIRYDFRRIQVWNISQSVPRTIENFHHAFHNLAFSGGAKWQIKEGLKLGFNAGLVQRAPEVNELYSSGLHQGVSGIEEGNRNLAKETSVKGILTLDWDHRGKIFVQAHTYYQLFDRYIFLQPNDEFRLTIRGAFPVFEYAQTEARIYGFDLLTKIQPRDEYSVLLKYAMVRGWDRAQDIPLIFMPADNASAAFHFHLPSLPHWENTYFKVEARYLWEQTRLLESQDFQAPPPAYFLMGMQFGTKKQWDETALSFSLGVENLWNTPYRDYLNRLRYFSDEIGRNVVANIRFTF